MDFWKRGMNLQLFADGGDGADAGADAGAPETVENTADDEQKRLLELNVPRDKVERWAKRKAAREKTNGFTPKPQKPDATAQTQTAAKAEPTEEPAAQEEPKKPTWDELMKDPDYNKAMQETIKARLKKAGGSEDFTKRVAPILARQFGLDAENLDLAALSSAVEQSEQSQREETEAGELGVSVDTYRQIRQTQQRENDEFLDQRLHEHAARVVREAEELKALFPNFDLMAERQNNEIFRRMVDNPDNPVPLKTAYLAAHHDELVQSAVQTALQNASRKLTASVQANAKRPEEAGTERQASSITHFDYSKASKQEREALKARIRAAAARGEKIYPGM